MQLIVESNIPLTPELEAILKLVEECLALGIS